jgi:hypothetical protein
MLLLLGDTTGWKNLAGKGKNAPVWNSETCPVPLRNVSYFNFTYVSARHACGAGVPNFSGAIVGRIHALSEPKLDEFKAV